MAFINQKKTLQVVKTEYVPAVYQTKTITPQNQTREITADAGYAALSKVILNGLLVDPHESYTTNTDATTAYQKTVPAGALKYAILDKLGFMSYKSVNLIPKENLTETIIYQGVTITNNNDGSITLNGTYIGGEGAGFKIADNLNIPAGDYAIAYFNDKVSTGANDIFRFNAVNDATMNVGYLGSTTNLTATKTTSVAITSLWLRLSLNTTFDNLTIKPMLVSGSTAPTTYQPYFEGLRHSAVTSIESKDSNNTTLYTLAIPNSVQALTNYGKGVNENCYNYILFVIENGQLKVYFYEDVLDVDLGTLNYTQFISNNRYIYRTNDIPNIIPQESVNIAANALCSIYRAVKQTDTWVDKDMAYYDAAGFTSFAFVNNDYITTETFKTGMSGVHLLYQKATTTITDITAYFEGLDNFVEVEPNGTITFNNTYNQAVPSEVTYLVEV